MRGIWRIIPVVPAVSIALATLVASAGPAQASAKYTVKVTGVARNGAVVKVLPTIISAATGQPYAVGGYVVSGGHTIRLPAGRYEVGASVPTFGNSGAEISETLVARFVTIRRRTVVRLDARRGRRLQVALDAPGATPRSFSATVCLRAGGDTEAVTAYSSPGRIYVVPLATRHLPFKYEAAWQGQLANVSYNLAGSRRGVPTHPSFHFKAARLARVRLAVRSGAAISDNGGLTLTRGGQNQRCSDSGSLPQPVFGGPAITDYRTPGKWSTSLDMYLPNGDDYANWDLTRTYRAGRAYDDTFSRAARGPALSFPEVQGDFFDYSPTGYFSDPVMKGFECCSKATITLRHHGSVIKRATLTDWRSQRDFTRFLHRKGWYTLQVQARRFRGSTPIPGGILSPRVSLAWRFHLTPGPRAGSWQNMPVSLTRFVPAGLNAGNDAPASATTPVKFRIVRAPNEDLPTPKHLWRTVRIGASFNDGATWHALRFRRHGNSGVVDVRDPATAGHVSLRITVIDSRGDSTVETIYRAYAVR